jgi:outer membrane protein assembly factor BamA
MGVRLKQIPFLTERIPCRVLFQSDKAKIELFLEKKPASRFDGIVGLLPNNQTGSLLFTGDVLLKLHNSFNRGELLEINWRRLQVATQDLKTRFVYPFLLKSPFGADLTFKLYKKDSTFLEVNPNIGVQYQLTGGNYFKVFFNRRSMVLLSTNHLKYLTILPDYADIATTLYGIGLKLERLDSPLNPRKGYLLQGATSAGNRTIKKNQKLNESIYKDVQLQSVQYMSEVEGMIYFPVRNRSTLKMANQSAWIKTPTLFTNDLYRIGGLKTLRGFDEESIAASLYSIFTFEYRFLFEENSNLSFFSDVAYYENNSLAFKGDRYDLAYSVGAGIHFQTKAGIFSMNYALGSQYNNGIDSRRGKIHFGIVNNF